MVKLKNILLTYSGWAFAAILLLIQVGSGLYAQSKSTTFNMYNKDGHMYIGADYYPEHWPEERWEYDAKLMKDAGFNIVRLAEFSWSILEPEEGRYDFNWLDKVVALLDRYDIKVVLGTPTAVMPAWCARKYPQTLAMQADGSRMTWGGRKNNCFSDTTYRSLSRRITRAMAVHFAHVPNVIGWQTDNEFAGTDCRCESCRHEFQNWLQRKYKSLDELNKSWGTHFWGLQVSRWDEITIPDSRSGSWAISNPSASLDWLRFTSWLNVRFQQEQLDLLREICPNQFVTHNFQGLHQGMDFYDLAENLDFVSWDNYPELMYRNKPAIPYDASFAADVMRGLKQKNFWIMEQTAGPVGWGIFSPNVRPGELQKICFQQIAHGADAQIWFRWRTCTAGREQYWHGLLGHDGRPLRRYHEAVQTAANLRKIEKYLRGTTIKSDVAIFYDYDNIWAINIQPGFEDNSVQNAIRHYYNALIRAGVNVDFISRGSDLSKYKIVLAPCMFILPDETAAEIDQFIENGGIFLADCRTAVKDENNLAHDRTLPGILSPALGIEIEEYESLNDSEYHLTGENGFTGNFTAVKYTDWIIPKSAQVLAGYSNPWHMVNFAALTKNNYGHGQAWYVGTVVKEDGFYDQLIQQIIGAAGLELIIKSLPIGVETSLRQGSQNSLLFVINHTEQNQTVLIPAGKLELLSGKKMKDTIELERYGIAIIKL